MLVKAKLSKSWITVKTLDFQANISLCIRWTMDMLVSDDDIMSYNDNLHDWIVGKPNARKEINF